MQSSILRAGFVPYPYSGPFSATLGPLYTRPYGPSPIVGLQAASKHCDSDGVLERSVLMLYACTALSLLCRGNGGYSMRLSTLSLTVVGEARVGDWLEAQTTRLFIGRRIGSALCLVDVNGIRIATADGAFQVFPAPTLYEEGHS